MFCPPESLSGSCTPATASSDQAVLQVRDEGIGIPEESLPYLFEPFFRAANADRSVMQGMGVGLGVVKELVQLHGGSVSVVSVEGRHRYRSLMLSEAPLPLMERGWG
jgi:signal transduction histidine kinase